MAQDGNTTLIKKFTKTIGDSSCILKVKVEEFSPETVNISAYYPASCIYIYYILSCTTHTFDCTLQELNEIRKISGRTQCIESSNDLDKEDLKNLLQNWSSGHRKQQHDKPIIPTSDMNVVKLKDSLCEFKLKVVAAIHDHEMQSFSESVEQLKECISLCRRLQRIAFQDSADANSIIAELDYLAVKCYYNLGCCYRELNLPAKAKACFVLGIKLFRKWNSKTQFAVNLDNETQLMNDSDINSGVVFAYDVACGKQLVRIMQDDVTTNCTSRPSLETAIDANHDHSEPMSEEAANANTPDIEELLAMHQVKSLDDTFHFSCTQCGECCRTADNIFLSPVDLFAMSRAPNMASIYRIYNTNQLISHPDFKLAFYFVLKRGYPICSLRPVKSRTGRCLFSYELFYGEKNESAVRSNGEDLHTCEDDNIDPIENIVDDKSGETRRVSTMKPIRILSAEECHQRSSSPSSSSSMVFNSYGRPALGCLFGPLHMPAICSSYPMAPELSMADFWHVRKASWYHHNSTIGTNAQPVTQSSDPEDAFHKQKLSTGWQAEEQYVVVASPSCEGFHVGEAAVRRTPLSRHGEQLAIIQDAPPSEQPACCTVGPVADGHLAEEECGDLSSSRCIDDNQYDGKAVHATVSEAPSSTTIEPSTVRQFLIARNNGENDISSKLEYSHWFQSLVAAVTDYFPADTIPNPQIKNKFVNVMAKIWYNFDSCSKSSRPIKSISRLMRDISAVTWAVVKATQQYLANNSIGNDLTDGERESLLCCEYDRLLRMLLDTNDIADTESSVQAVDF